MKAKNIWVIVPFSRPHWLENVKSNFLRQKFKNKKIVIVENGDAIGACNKNGFKPDLLLTSNPHQADAKNTALEAVKEAGGEFWTTFDDDDYYGSEYLSELHENSDKGDVIGKSSIFTKTVENKLRLLDGREFVSTIDLHGPTLSGWMSATIPFPNTGQWGEDMAQVLKMQWLGAKFWATSKYNFIFQRHANHKHTWHTTDHQISQCWYKFQEGFNPKVIEFESSNIYDIADRKEQIPEGKLIPFEEWKMSDSPCYTFEKKRVGSFDDWIEKQMKEMK